MIGGHCFRPLQAALSLRLRYTTARHVLKPSPLTLTRRDVTQGFTLLRSAGVCGYKGVTVCRTSKSNPFKAAGESVGEPGKLVHLGLYPTAVEAAVAVARHAATGEVPTKRKRAVGRTGRGKKQHARESSGSSAGDSGYSDEEQETAAVMGEMPSQLPLQLASQPLPQPPPPPPLCHAPDLDGMAAVRAMLVDFRLAQYSDVFEEQVVVAPHCNKLHPMYPEISSLSLTRTPTSL